MKKKANNRATFESIIRTAVTMNFLVDSLVQVTSEKSPPIRARAAVFQKCVKKPNGGIVRGRLYTKRQKNVNRIL